MASVAYESGGFAQIVSLAGIVGTSQRGRQIDIYGGISVTTTGRQVLSNNPRRISALIQNRGAVPLNCFFDMTTIAFTLLPGESFQIDKDFPWTGQMFVQGSGATCNPVYVIEVSVA